MPRGFVRSKEAQTRANVQEGADSNGISVSWSKEVRGRPRQGVGAHLGSQGEGPQGGQGTERGGVMIVARDGAETPLHQAAPPVFTHIWVSSSTEVK